MEGKVKNLGFARMIARLPLLFLSLAMAVAIHAQESSQAGAQNEPGQLSLQKTAQSRDYQGREVEGEEKRVGPGDTLWRMLVKEKGLPENHFSQYLVIIRGLNPQIKKSTCFEWATASLFLSALTSCLRRLPCRQRQTCQRSPVTRGAIKEYRVKQGEHLYQILREQLGIAQRSRRGIVLRTGQRPKSGTKELGCAARG